MIQPQIKSVQCMSPAGLHKMAYKEWGDPDNPKVLVCVHGVTRVSDDFDILAAELCSTYRVVCPDVVGRGRSDWLRDPQYYWVWQYTRDMATLLARLNTESVDWVGTSMGGLIGMELAALPGNPIKKLVMNDIGPTLETGSLNNIGNYIGQELRFPTFEDAEVYIRAISVSFGPHSDEEWRKIAASVLRQNKNGEWVRHYDLALADAFKQAYFVDVEKTRAERWKSYEAITCPTLVLRGSQSALLSAEGAKEMTQYGPKAKLVEFEGVGHAPTLVHEDQISVVRNFLLG
ncbi:MAG: alpha/beta hydrolase [Burkholderiales bacterium]|nr:alpha/beta hydrolase [Burkholderiales bacterium]